MVKPARSHLIIGVALTYILVSLTSHGINFLQLPEQRKTLLRNIDALLRSRMEMIL